MDGRLVDVHREMRIVRLGEDVDRTRELSRDAVSRTISALSDYAAIMRSDRATRVRMCATSAVRDARNGDDFLSAARDVLGVAPEVISGGDEAALSYSGATAELSPDVFAPPYLVVDIGGGSTEIATERDGSVVSASLPLGCVRLEERWLQDDPPSRAQVREATADIDGQLLLASAMAPADGVTLLGLAGSVTTVTALVLGLPAYDPERIHLARVTLEDVDRVTSSLLAMTLAERRALPVIHPGRADVIPAGALVLRRLMEVWSLDAVVASERDILDGIAWSIVADDGGQLAAD